MLKTLFVGIDISLKTATCCFLSQEGKFHGKPFDIANNLPNFENLKQVNKTIEEQSMGFTNPLSSVKGIGPVYATGIMAYVGDVKRFSSHDQLALNQMRHIWYVNVISI